MTAARCARGRVSLARVADAATRRVYSSGTSEVRANVALARTVPRPRVHPLIPQGEGCTRSVHEVARRGSQKRAVMPNA